VLAFLLPAEIRKIKSQPACGRLLPPVQKRVATSIFAPWGKNANGSPTGH
jgi:hypothetical protein